MPRGFDNPIMFNRFYNNIKNYLLIVKRLVNPNMVSRLIKSQQINYVQQDKCPLHLAITHFSHKDPLSPVPLGMQITEIKLFLKSFIKTNSNAEWEYERFCQDRIYYIQNYYFNEPGQGTNKLPFRHSSEMPLQKFKIIISSTLFLMTGTVFQIAFQHSKI